MDKEIEQLGEDIKTIKIQGATNVTKAILNGLKDYSKRIQISDANSWYSSLSQASQYLLALRPTEPLAQNAIFYVFREIKNVSGAKEKKEVLQRSADYFLNLIESVRKKIVEQAGSLIEEGDHVFTHCHSSLVVESLTIAQQQGKKFEVFNTETRPLMQGRLTSRDLLAKNISSTLVTDSSGPFLISRWSGEKLMMNKIFLGADALLISGGAINKVGSFGLSLAAHSEKVPVYVLASLLKFNPRNWIDIEKRPAAEIWPEAPKDLKIINFAFDFIPSKYITGIICEAGIIKPRDLKKRAQLLYPWLFSKNNF